MTEYVKTEDGAMQATDRVTDTTVGRALLSEIMPKVYLSIDQPDHEQRRHLQLNQRLLSYVGLERNGNFC